jgi:hypothetical protein
MKPGSGADLADVPCRVVRGRLFERVLLSDRWLGSH